MGLVDFLRARLDEDERAARAVPGDLRQPWSDPGPWVMAGDGGGGREAEVAKAAPGLEMPIAEAVAHHIARHDPARVLAEVDAKRQILALHSVSEGHECSTRDRHGDIDHCTWVMDSEACTTLRLLALPYAAHPDYREEWRP